MCCQAAALLPYTPGSGLERNLGSGQKKVIVRRFSPGLLRGYVPASGFVSHEDGTPALEMLDLAGRVQAVPLPDVKIMHFVREFNLTDETNPERLPRKQFLARPRTEGLWVQLRFRDGDEMEGLAALDLSLASGLVEDQGLQMVPPDVRGNSQRVYVPRSALSGLQIVAVVTTPTRRKQLEQLASRMEAGAEMSQPDLFSGAREDR